MESSEDDAGTATSASCRASAREKDVGLAEDVYATRNFQHESSEARASCGTPAMSEDNFDGDSVPSPSAKDTSTEAILDMIDDFIDGPGAPRRVPLLSSVAAERACSRIPAVAVNSQSVSRDNPQHNNELANRNEQIVVPLCEPSPAPSANSESLNESVHVLPAEAVCMPHSEILICVNQSTTEESPQASSSVQADINETNSMQQQESSQNVEPEMLAEVLVVAPPSSSVEPLQVVSDASESENLDRTVKCVTSSENRDSVTVELAESTSSECSVSESKTLSVEPTMSRSPLKRRLIRPAPSDRRPDSTVSSTADSQTIDIFTTEQTCSETVTKDVSSSSDAVSNVHGNTKPEEISIVSEISICKAETSTAPSRKIKLVRPKITPVMIYSTKTETQSTSATFEKDQCQSTSSDDISTPSSADPSVKTSMFTATKSEEHKSEQEQVCDGTIVEQQSIQMSGLAQDVLINTHNIPISEIVEEKSQNVETPEVPILNQTNNESPVVSTVAPSVIQNFVTDHLIADLQSEEGKVCDDSNNHENILEQEKKLPPIKLSLSAAKPSETSSKTDHLEAQCSNTNVEIPESSSVDDKSKLSLSLVECLVSEDPPSSYDQDSKINEELEKVSDMVKNDNKKVPPIKLNLSNTEHNKTTESCNIKNSRIEDESTSHKSEDCVKQVPKLTIKLSNKYSEEAKSSVPKLTIKPLRPPPEADNTDDSDITQQIPTVTKINIKPIPKPAENQYGNIPKPLQPPVEQSTGEREIKQQIPSITKIHIKPILKPTEKEHIESTSKLVRTPQGQDTGDINQQIPCVTKINIKPILKPTEKENETIALESTTKQSTNEQEIKQQIPSVTKINIKPIPKPSEKANEGTLKPLRLTEELNTDESDIKQQIPCVTKINIKPIPKPSEKGNEGTSKSLCPPAEQSTADHESNPHIPSVTKINIKPIPKPPQKVNDSIPKLPETHQNDLASRNEQVPNITKLNIKPIVKPPEKVKEIHRKSSSSEISESEYSENDESTSTSDQASASDQGPLETVPKVTIKLGKPGTESEGKFYTEKNVPKLTIKNIQHSEKDDQDSKLKLVVSQSDDKPPEKIPKITIKAVTKCDSQPVSPKLTIKPLKPPENVNKVNEIPKLKISADTHSSCAEIKENPHVPKITIKPVTKTDGDGTAKTLKKSIVMCDSSEHIPVVTKLNIKPILKPTESGESSESFDEKVPVVSKLNIKPVVKPKDNEVDSSIEDVPKIIKLNIKPLKNPEEISSEEKDCDEMNADIKDCSIPVVTKINIKPIVKPVEDEALKDSENQSSETGNSSDDNVDHIPIVTKLNIKPIVKPSELEDPPKPVHNEQCIPVVTKLNIKPLVKPEDNLLPSSPKKESLRSPGSAGIPVVTKLNIKPIVKPEEQQNRTHEDNTEKSSKHPSLVMKINKNKVCDSITEKEHLCNNVAAKAHSPKISNSPKHIKRSAAVDSNVEVSLKLTSLHNTGIAKIVDGNPDSPSLLQTDSPTSLVNSSEAKIIPEKVHETTILNEASSTKEQPLLKSENANKAVNEHFVQESSSAKTDPSPVVDNMLSKMNAFQINEVNEVKRAAEHYNTNYKKASVQNCTLLKKLLSSTKEEFDRSQDLKPSNCASQSEKSESILSNCNDTIVPEERDLDLQKRLNPKAEKASDIKLTDSFKMRSIQDVHREANESVTKPLEISITDKIINQGSGQESPRIILKINKTDHGASAKIITEDTHKPTDCSPSNESPVSEPAVESVNDVPSPKKLLVNSRRKAATLDSPANLTMGKRLRSSRIVETPEKSPAVKRNANKRPSVSESIAPPQQKEGELSIIEAKRMKLEQFLSSNKSLTITPVVSNTKQTSPSKSTTAFSQGGKVSHNHSLLSNENCSQKNGNSKLHNILSNLQAKQMQTLQMNDTSVSAKPAEITTEVECNTSTGSSDVIVEITRVENCHPEVQEMLINENSVCDLTGPDEVSQDPLEVESVKPPLEEVVEPAMLQTIELTPTPRKRGRPRKLPLTESAKPITPAPLPVLALEERPQRSLRLMRDRPTILRKPRGGRGRGRGARRAVAPLEPKPEPDPEPEREPEPEPEPTPEPEPMVVVEVVEPIDPTSSRIKLPRMTEALDKSVAGSAASPDLKLFGTAAVVLESSVKADEFMKTPEATRPRSGRGSRGGRIRTPRNRGRGRGGGRGAMYMKETLGIYGRVCGPATTTVQLFEEETCMMDDNATPSKPSHLLDEDSQSSVKSSTNDSNKMKKSKFADLFDSNKVWTAADVKEYIWPTPETPNAEPQVMMIQEQVAMFLGVKSFKRRYPELKRRTVGGEEREYVLSKGVVSEALCDLGITAVDASEVLDIMLSDYPHKYEEYRSHQRQKQIASSSEEAVESKIEERPIKVEIKVEKVVEKPEPPKVDPEKTRQDMAAAAIASAAEWNARANAWRRPACVDLQSNTIHRRRAPPAPPPVRVRPPAGFYPHALLPGQYQHWYRAYTSEQLRYFPLNTVLAAPPAARSPTDSGSESEGSWERCSSSDDSAAHVHEPKRKKLSRKRSIQQEKEREEARADAEPVDTCRVCKLRLEANRKYTHERFLVCANCNSKLHPVCVELPADTIRKCREYPWQCAECKSCGSCHAARDADKMLFCDLCDRGYHSYCVGLDHVPSGRWHCVECAICKSCGARDPNGLSPSTPGPSTPGPSTPGPSTPGPSIPGPSTSGLSTPGPSTPGSSTPGLSSGPGEWHHQTRRGPGGHKVYSHSLCTPCARAYRIGRYCPLCERSFIGPKGTMQLVICKLCDRQLHQECVRATVSQLRVLDYTCGECRRGGITSRAAAVRVAPRTIATLFMAKRRFNKYAHRQYLASRLQALQDEESADPPDPPPAAD